jgi:predicted membrane channel-forming protein YqfA (hemolysin III family)
MLGLSAHTTSVTPRSPRPFGQLDHAAIFVMIVGAYIPFAMSISGGSSAVD